LFSQDYRIDRIDGIEGVGFSQDYRIDRIDRIDGIEGTGSAEVCRFCAYV